MSKAHLEKPEFSRPLLVDRVPRKGSHEVFKADAKECAALAKRFNIPNLFTLSARMFAAPWRGGGLKVTGTVEADIEQLSVISLEAFRTLSKFEVERYFLQSKDLTDGAEEDADPIINGEIDLGSIVAEALGLELDPYPRKPGESFSSPATEN